MIDRLGAWMREYMRWMYGRCQRVMVPSEATRQLLIRARGHVDRIQLWTRGVDTLEFSPWRRSPALRKRWRASADRPALLYVGRISKEKGLDLLPGLQASLRQRGIEPRLIVAGAGPMQAGLRTIAPTRSLLRVRSVEMRSPRSLPRPIPSFSEPDRDRRQCQARGQVRSCRWWFPTHGRPQRNMRPGIRAGVGVPGSGRRKLGRRRRVR